MRRRGQEETTGHCGKKVDPSYQASRARHAGCQLLIETQQQRIVRLFAGDNHAEIEVTWSVCQDIITAYCNADRAARTTTLWAVIDSISSGVPAGLVELRKSGRTMNKRVVDVLAYFERLGTLKGPTEAINGLIEHLG